MAEVLAQPVDLVEQSVEELLTLGKKRGYLTWEEMNESLPDEAISPDKLEEIMLRLEENGIEMVDEAETYIMSAMRKSSLIDGMFRRDITEYPRESLRESIANAVAHRDYSPYVRGSYIQIRMFADRLEVQSPGGLFGNVTVDNLEDEHSTRNARLMRMMEDMQVVENRGSGMRHAPCHARGQSGTSQV